MCQIVKKHYIKFELLNNYIYILYVTALGFKAFPVCHNQYSNNIVIIIVNQMEFLDCCPRCELVALLMLRLCCSSVLMMLSSTFSRFCVAAESSALSLYESSTISLTLLSNNLKLAISVSRISTLIDCSKSAPSGMGNDIGAPCVLPGACIILERR